MDYTYIHAQKSYHTHIYIYTLHILYILYIYYLYYICISSTIYYPSMDDSHDIRQLDLLRIDLQLLEAHRRHAGLPDLEAEDEVDAFDANDGDGEMEEVLLEPEPKPEADGMG